MRIWIFNQYTSTPDQPTTGAYYMMKALADKGVDVHVFPAAFSYYTRKDEKLNGKLLHREERDGNLTFHWVRSFPTDGRILTRAINMLTYSLSAFSVALFMREKPDFVIGVCPHPFAGFTAWLTSLLRGGKFIYEVRDIWPESPIEGGLLKKESFVARTLFLLQKFLYQRAHLVISVLPHVDAYLKETGVSHQKFLWLPNGVAIDQGTLAVPRAVPDTAEGVFNVYYLGGHSKYHAIDDILDAAKILAEHNEKTIRFVLIGDGSEKPRLMARAQAEGITNVIFKDAMPRKDVAKALGDASCFVLTSRTMPVHRFGISPNKICDFMLAARPTILAIPSAGDSIIESQSGLVIDSANPQALADAILKLRALSPEERLQMGIRAQKYALENFDSGKLAEKLLKAISSA